jgi:hypothetical protein
MIINFKSHCQFPSGVLEGLAKRFVVSNIKDDSKKKFRKIMTNVTVFGRQRQKKGQHD